MRSARKPLDVLSLIGAQHERDDCSLRHVPASMVRLEDARSESESEAGAAVRGGTCSGSAPGDLEDVPTESEKLVRRPRRPRETAPSAG
jgi:hypothetical protein